MNNGLKILGILKPQQFKGIGSGVFETWHGTDLLKKTFNNVGLDPNINSMNSTHKKTSHSARPKRASCSASRLGGCRQVYVFNMPMNHKNGWWTCQQPFSSLLSGEKTNRALQQIKAMIQHRCKKCPVQATLEDPFRINFGVWLWFPTVAGSEIRRSPVDMENIPCFIGFS